MAKKNQTEKKPAMQSTAKCWCSHTKAEHSGPDGMCKFNSPDEARSGCDCGGFDAA